MKDLGGRVAFITGGASGIGLGIARIFLRAGIRVAIADVSRENLDDAAVQLAAEPGEHLLLQLDVTDRVAFARAADAAEQRFGKVHLLCNNAGIDRLAAVATVVGDNRRDDPGGFGSAGVAAVESLRRPGLKSRARRWWAVQDLNL